jgi:YegS/Rv2252/BmrU family lipid kinase
VIINPTAKCLADGTCSLERIEDTLRAVGIVAEVCMTEPDKPADQLARIAVERGDRLLIIAGGDGTIEAIVPELVGASTTLGILPMGTMNNFARALGVPLDLNAACLLLAMGATRRIDLGRVVTPDHRRDGYFLESAGVGLSALAAPMGEAVEKGEWMEVLNKLGDFFSFTAAQMTILCDGGEWFQTEAQVVTISNAPLFGNNMLIAPLAKLDDGWLDLAIYVGMNKVDLGRYFLNASSAGRVDEPRVHFRRVRSVQIMADAPLAVNADLDVLAEQHAWTFEVIPHAVTVIAGNGIGLTFPVDSAPLSTSLQGQNNQAE